MSTKENVVVLLCCCAICLAGGYLVGSSRVKETVKVEVRERTSTVTVRDTVRAEISVPRNVYVVRVDTLHLPGDTVYLTVPITRQTYSTDDYRALIEGYRVRLVEMDVYPKTTYITTERDVIRTVVERVVFMPFASFSYSTLGSVGVGGGAFYHSLGFEYLFNYELRGTSYEKNRRSWHQVGLKWKF